MQAESDLYLDILEARHSVSTDCTEALPADRVAVVFLDPRDLNQNGRRELFTELLSAEERHRHARFYFERDRDLFLAAHGLLRVTLSRFQNVDPKAWRFVAGTHGRPEICDLPSRLRFSLSHTRGLAACAVCLDRDIGLDVEDLSKGAPDGVAERFFSPAEVADFHRTAPEGRVSRFFTYWTLKEAYIKARGLGLSLPLDQFSLYQAPDADWRISFDSVIPDDPARWRFWSWRVGGCHQAAVAISRKD